MEFRWFALIALWTLLAGPVLYSPTALTSSASRQPVHAVPPPHPAGADDDTGAGP